MRIIYPYFFALLGPMTLVACGSDSSSTQDPIGGQGGASPAAGSGTLGGASAAGESPNSQAGGPVGGGGPLAGSLATGQTGAAGSVAAGAGATGSGPTGSTGAGATGGGGTTSVVAGAGPMAGNGGSSAGGAPSAGAAGEMGGTTGEMGGAAAGSGSEGEAGAGPLPMAGAGGQEPETEPEETCPLPTSFSWTSSGPLAQPREGWASIKDFTVVFHEGEYIVYMTNHDMGDTWGAAMFTFGDWSEAAVATQQPMDRTSVAPTLFYFAPKDIWVLAYQWGSTSFSYATSTNPKDPESWSGEQNLYNYTGELRNSGTGPIDQHVICDETDCYLFFNGDNGEIYRSSMPIDDFPGTFGPHETIMSGDVNDLFEGIAVYSIKGSDQYLMLMESIGAAGRYFSAFTTDDLGGDWTDLRTTENDPFAGRANVMFEGGNAWTTDISHGDLVRHNPDQTMEIDFCNLELLYQGRDPSSDGGDYGRLPYRPGLLTLVP